MFQVRFIDADFQQTVPEAENIDKSRKNAMIPAHSMDIERILLDLVKIRSDKRPQADGTLLVEQDIVSYLQALLAKEFGWLKVEVQSLTNGRANLFVHDDSPVDVLFMAHMDTVEEGAGWTKNVRGEVDGDKIYGRGSADMKAGLVAILDALVYARESGKKGIAALFYADEEYAFLGMQSFLEEYGNRLSPRFVICPEPTQEQIRPGCRGIIEWKFVVEGKRGHAARPHTGVSAFLAFEKGIEALRTDLARIEDGFLGKPTLNVAAVTVGSLMETHTDGSVRLSQAANIIPDYCEAVVEIRSVPGTNENALRKAFEDAVAAFGARSLKTTLVHNIGSFTTPKEQLVDLEIAQRTALGEITYEDPTKGGYSDAQMAAAYWNIPTAIIGPKGAGMHGVDEYVERKSLQRLCSLFRAFIDTR